MAAGNLYMAHRCGFTDSISISMMLSSRTYDAVIPDLIRDPCHMNHRRGLAQHGLRVKPAMTIVA
jgi:hypothetical protein